jgi:hypothetical protein
MLNRHLVFCLLLACFLLSMWSTLKMEAACSSETSENFCSAPHSHRCENIKSHLLLCGWVCWFIIDSIFYKLNIACWVAEPVGSLLRCWVSGSRSPEFESTIIHVPQSSDMWTNLSAMCRSCAQNRRALKLSRQVLPSQAHTRNSN